MTKLSVLIPKYKDLTIKAVQNSCIELSARVYERNPVDTGLSQASWTSAINSFDRSNSGDGKFIETARKLKAGDTYTLMNTQPYIRRLEYEGHSNQAPNGMVRISIAEFPQIVRAAIRGVKNGS